MHRIVKRIVSLSLTTLFVGACVAACASEEPTYDSSVFEGNRNACVKQFCPDVGGKPGCCVPGTTMCGMDNGMGCVTAAVPDAGG